MNTLNQVAGRKVAFPFYIFISLLLGYFGIVAVKDLWTGGEISRAVFISILFIAHIGLYWINFSGPNRSKRWWVFYYLLQTPLMVGFIFLLNGRSTVGLSFIFSTTISLVGEALGVWGNSRRSLFLGIFYFGLLIGLFFVFSERERFYEALASLFVNGGAIILLMVMFNQQMAEREKAIDLAESLESANAKLAAYNAKIESLTLQNERQRMARELHDTLAQGVAGLILQLEAVKAHLSSDRKERASSIVEQALLRARATLSESRAAIDDLRSASGNLSKSVNEKVNRFIHATGIPCGLEISVSENQFSNETITHALNIFSEALANVTRHAQAKNVKAKFVIQKEKLQLEVRDDGKGFDINQETGRHYGLLGMKERARLTNGNLEIESNQNGTRIHFNIEGAK